MMKQRIWPGALLLWAVVVPVLGNVMNGSPAQLESRWRVATGFGNTGAMTLNDYADAAYLPAKPTSLAAAEGLTRPFVVAAHVGDVAGKTSGEPASQRYNRVPEPGSFALFGLGLLGLALIRRQLKH
jgi:hypothetical protein